MRILELKVAGFRGIRECKILFQGNSVITGPNGVGKSTIVDALSLALGKTGMVPELTEHDFWGSNPERSARILITVTVGGFATSDPEDYPQWFQSKRAVEKWWRSDTSSTTPVNTNGKLELCVQIGFAARFDFQDLSVEQVRFFVDDDSDAGDPFLEESVTYLPKVLLDEIGFFVLPARRTWSTTISFGSEIFRRAVAASGGVPAEAVLRQLTDLRKPRLPIEQDAAISRLVEKIDNRLSQLLPERPKLQLRLTSTDSASLLKSLVPHFQKTNESALPASRHGTGLLAPQTLVLLLEVGRSRKEKRLPFILAIEEPELHVPPGLQSRLIGEALSIADQVLCTTHSPRVAANFEPTSVFLLRKEEHPNNNFGEEKRGVELPLTAKPLISKTIIDEKNAIIQLLTEHRERVIEALMFPILLIPEGRIDCEWLRLINDVAEREKRIVDDTSVLPFGAMIGVIPTRDSNVKATFDHLKTLRNGILVLVDGDQAGDTYLKGLLESERPPEFIFQWRSGWAIEDAIKWILETESGEPLRRINERLGKSFINLEELVASLKDSQGKTGGLKQHYFAHEMIAGAMKYFPDCIRKASELLQAIVNGATGCDDKTGLLKREDNSSNMNCTVYRIEP